MTLSDATPPVLTEIYGAWPGIPAPPAASRSPFFDGDATPVDIETVTVSGNGTYTTPTGFTLPTTGTVTGTYQWNATNSEDLGEQVDQQHQR